MGREFCFVNKQIIEKIEKIFRKISIK